MIEAAPNETIEPIHAPSSWIGRDLADRTDWIYPLSIAEIDDVLRVVAELSRAGRPRDAVSREDVRFEKLRAALSAWRNTLAHGRGFVLVRGLPVERMSDEEATLAYWAIGVHLGTPVAQNLRGELLTHVRDTGANPSDPSTRLYKTRAEQDFHTDGADIIGLLCLHTSKSGGESRIVSSVSVFNEVVRRRPDLAPVLFANWHWHYHEPEMESPVHFTRPICARRGSGLNTFFIPWYIRRAQALEGVPRFTPDQTEVLALVERLANDPSLYLDMEFRPGDIQLLKNSVILHKRTEYEDYEEPDRKRHLLRLWLAAPDFDDGDEQLRRGISEVLP
jgi:hypothetical protein